MNNPLTTASGTYRVLRGKPNPQVLMAIPLKENPVLNDAGVLQMCLLELQIMYPAITQIQTFTQDSTDGPILGLIIS